MRARNVPAPSAASVTWASPRGHKRPRMPATLEELLQQRASLRLQLLRNATAVRVAQAHGKARRARPMSVKPQWTLTTPLRKLLLHMYVQAGYEPGPAADYVEALACRKKWTTRARDDIGKFIED
jgi:hypothetical protein